MNEKYTREGTLLAYLWQEMTAPQRADFEAQLARDAGLRADLEATRATLSRVHEWMDAPAPGVEHAQALPVPLLRENLRMLRPRIYFRSLRRVAGIAAIFVFGFSLGYLAQTMEFHPGPPVPVVTATYPPETARIRYARQEDGRMVFGMGENSVWVVDRRFQLAASEIDAATGERT